MIVQKDFTVAVDALRLLAKEGDRLGKEQTLSMQFDIACKNIVSNALTTVTLIVRYPKKHEPRKFFRYAKGLMFTAIERKRA